MKIIIEGAPKEIAALVLELQERQEERTNTQTANAASGMIIEKEDGITLCAD